MLLGRNGMLLRRVALLAGLVAVLACVGAGRADAAPLVLTANQNGDSVSVIDAQTNAVIGQPITVGTQPESVAITPNGRFAYVPDHGSDDVSVIEIAGRRVVATIPVGIGPETVAISPDGTTAYVADRGADEVSVIDTQTDQKVGTIAVGGDPAGLAFSPDGTFAYVAINSDETVEVIDTQTRKVVGSPIPVGLYPTVVTFAPDGGTAYVSDVGSSEVSAINTSTHKVTSIEVGPDPWGIAVNRESTVAFVGEQSGGEVWVLNLATDQVVKKVKVEVEAYEVALTPDGKTLYVGGPADIRAINTETFAEVGAPNVLPDPFTLAITPDQSPTAAFTWSTATANFPTAFSGAASADQDGTISSYAWAFGDGTTGTGVAPTHTYSAAGTYSAKLSVVDNEGCGEAEVFSGRTAYCSGGASSVTQAVTVSPVPNNFRFGRLIHNRKNGTVKLQVKLPAAGSLQLRGGKVHPVSKKFGHKGSMWLVVHPRIEVNKRLKKVRHLRVKVRVKFSPTGGSPKSKSRSFQLLRTRRKKHRR